MSEIYTLIIEKSGLRLSQVEKVAVGVFNLLKKYGCYQEYKRYPNRLRLFFSNDLSKYHKLAYASMGLMIKVVKLENKSIQRKPIDFPEISKILDEINCMTKEEVKSHNRAQTLVEKEIGEIIKIQYDRRMRTIEIELALIRAIKKMKRRVFTAAELTTYSGIRYFLTDKRLFDIGIRTHLVTSLLDGLIKKGVRIRKKNNGTYSKF